MTDFAKRLATLRSEPSSDAARDPHRLARVALTREEMNGQGAAVARSLAAAEAPIAELAARLDGRRIGSVVFAGCGDSWFVGMAVRHAFETLLGVPALPAEAFDYCHYDSAGAGPGTLAFGLSAGGATPAVLGALDAARARGAFTVGVSNTPESPLLARYDAALPVAASRKGWPTQSSTAAMAVLLAAAARLARAEPAAALAAELSSLPERMARVLAAQERAMAEIGAALAPARLVLLTGAGPFFAAAAIGAAKLKELAPIHALAVPLEEMHHYRAQKAADPLVLLALDAASRERALDTALVGAAVGGRTVAILGRADREIEARVAHACVVPEAQGLTAPILAVLPLQQLAVSFALARAERGIGYPGAWPEGG